MSFKGIFIEFSVEMEAGKSFFRNFKLKLCYVFYYPISVTIKKNINQYER